jgi:hypothetical protein
VEGLATSLDELLAHVDWFGSEGGNAPPILVIDDFYDEPDAIRRQALDGPFVSYVPPDPAIVGEELGAANAHRPGRWLSSALVAYHGRPAQTPFHGERLNPAWLRENLETAIGEPIDKASWPCAGDLWNGAFHLVEEGYGVGNGFIHHHFKPGDIEGRGWSGVVYLSPDAPPSAGTSIWRRKRSGRCVAGFGEAYEQDSAQFELAYLAENRFNRAVLFRENVWHRLEHGFGHGKAARLTQTLFFEVAD